MHLGARGLVSSYLSYPVAGFFATATIDQNG